MKHFLQPLVRSLAIFGPRNMPKKDSTKWYMARQEKKDPELLRQHFTQRINERLFFALGDHAAWVFDEGDHAAKLHLCAVTPRNFSRVYHAARQWRSCFGTRGVMGKLIRRDRQIHVAWSPITYWVVETSGSAGVSNRSVPESAHHFPRRDRVQLGGAAVALTIASSPIDRNVMLCCVVPSETIRLKVYSIVGKST